MQIYCSNRNVNDSNTFTWEKKFKKSLNRENVEATIDNFNGN